MKTIFTSLVIAILTLSVNSASAKDCDTIILQNGDELAVVLEEIRLNEITYRKCDNQDGPLYVKPKAEVFLIKYSNGTREVVESQQAANPIENNTEDLVEDNRIYIEDLDAISKKEVIDKFNCYTIHFKDGDVRRGTYKVQSFDKISTRFVACSKGRSFRMNNTWLSKLVAENGEVYYYRSK